MTARSRDYAALRGAELAELRAALQRTLETLAHEATGGSRPEAAALLGKLWTLAAGDDAMRACCDPQRRTGHGRPRSSCR